MGPHVGQQAATHIVTLTTDFPVEIGGLVSLTTKTQPLKRMLSVSKFFCSTSRQLNAVYVWNNLYGG